MDKKFIRGQLDMLIGKKYSEPLTMKGRVEKEARHHESKPDIYDLLPNLIEDLLKFRRKAK